MGVAMISLMNIVWLQSAPTAFANIGWKFYLFFIIPGTIGSVLIWKFFPDTLGLPLEEVAAIFGDQDEVVSYMNDIEVTEEDIRKVQAGEGIASEKNVHEADEVEKAS